MKAHFEEKIQDTQQTYNILINAIKNQDDVLVKKLVQEHGLIAINGSDNKYETPLFTAILENQAHLVKFLLENGAINHDYLPHAIGIENFEVVKDLVDYINNPDDALFNLHALLSSQVRLFSSIEYSDKLMVLAEEVSTKVQDINANIKFSDYSNGTILESLPLKAIEFLFTKFHDQINQNTISDGLKDRSESLAQKFLSNKYLEATGNKETQLLQAVAHDAELAIQLLAEGVSFKADQLLTSLSNANSTNKQYILEYLVNQNVKIDWNIPIDNENNTIIMNMAKNGENNSVEFLVSATNSEGQKLYKLNQKNHNGEKLIDIYANQMGGIDGQNNLFPMIHFLRSHGSGEPRNSIERKDGSINVTDVYAPINTQIIPKVLGNLSQKYSNMTEDHMKNNIEMIKQIISSSEYELTYLDNDINASSIIQDALSNFEQLISNRETNNYDGETWVFYNQLAMIYEEIKELSHRSFEDNFLQSNFIITLAELHGCPWGKLVNLCKTIEGSSSSDPVVAINFNEFQSNPDKIANEFVEFAQEKLVHSEDLLKKFYSDVSAHYDQLDKFSLESERVLGCLYSYFITLAKNNNRSELNIYSSDINEFYDIIKYLVSEYADDNYEDNKFYQIIHKSMKVPFTEFFDPERYDISNLVAESTINLLLTNEELINSGGQLKDLLLQQIINLNNLFKEEASPLDLFSKSLLSKAIAESVNTICNEQNVTKPSVEEVVQFTLRMFVTFDILDLMYSEGYVPMDMRILEKNKIYECLSEYKHSALDAIAENNPAELEIAKLQNTLLGAPLYVNLVEFREISSNVVYLLSTNQDIMDIASSITANSVRKIVSDKIAKLNQEILLEQPQSPTDLSSDSLTVFSAIATSLEKACLKKGYSLPSNEDNFQFTNTLMQTFSQLITMTEDGSSIPPEITFNEIYDLLAEGLHQDYSENF